MIKIYKTTDLSNETIFKRANQKYDVSAAVSEIIDNVRKFGDKALIDYTRRFDKSEIEKTEVSEQEIETAYAETDEEFKRILHTAAQNIREFHRMQLRDGYEIKRNNGVIVGQKITPMDSVGLYVPGGTAAYPSTVLMDIIPALIAGCKQVIMVTPPAKDGTVNSAILAAAKVAGITKIYKVGGAQAIAALAYGTESIPKVDKIVGPGNAYVAEAKRQVFGVVSIDMIAGPSEIMILSDSRSNPKHLAADLLSQAEHDKMASAVLVTDSVDLAQAVSDELEKQIPDLLRCDIARYSIDENGKIIVTDNLDQAYDVVNKIAPEHLELSIDDPFEGLKKVKHAGSVFLGRNCPEALGDYYAGANHTLPTSGTAKFSSALSVDDFVKKTQYIYYDEKALSDVAADVAYFATKEGLTAHAKSAIIRTEGK